MVDPTLPPPPLPYNPNSVEEDLSGARESIRPSPGSRGAGRSREKARAEGLVEI